MHPLRQHGQITPYLAGGMSSGPRVAPSHGQRLAEPSCSASARQWPSARDLERHDAGWQGQSWGPSQPGSHPGEGQSSIRRSTGHFSGSSVWQSPPALVAKRAWLLASIFPAGHGSPGEGTGTGKPLPPLQLYWAAGGSGQAKGSRLLQHDVPQGADLNPGLPQSEDSYPSP